MMQQAKGKLVLEHLVVQEMGRSQQMRQQELDDLLRYGAEELFAERAPKISGRQQATISAPKTNSCNAFHGFGSLELSTPRQAMQAGIGIQMKHRANSTDVADGVIGEKEDATISEAPEEQQRQKRQKVTEEEQERGRLGGEKGRQIVYDDAALDKLLDR